MGCLNPHRQQARVSVSVQNTHMDEAMTLHTLSHEETQRTLHELQVHQVELEVQKDELCRTQHKLEIAHARYFELYDLAPVGYCTVNGKGSVLEANLTAAALLGVDRFALVGLPISRFILPDDLAIHRKLCNTLLEIGKTQACELRMVKKDGTVFWAHQKATLSERSSSGASPDADSASEFRIILSDISVRKAAELNLIHMLEESQRFRQALDQLSGFAYMKDLNFRYVYANQPTLEFFGCSSAELVGSDDDSFFPPDSARLLREVDTRVLAGQHTAEEIEIIDAKGERRVYWEVKTPIYADNACRTIWGLCGISTDITERKLTEEAVANSNRLLQAVINTVPMRVFWKDSELRYLGCNTAFAHDAGFACPADMIGKDDNQMAWREQAGSYRADDRRVMESGVPKLSYDEPQTTPAGEHIWLRTSKVPLCNETNGPTGILGIYEDITELKQSGLELQKKNVELEQFIYTVSHDLRSPLVTFKTFMGYLEKDMAEGNQEHLVQDIQFINAAADKMKLLLDELLELSRIGRVETPPVRVSLMALAAEALETLAGIISERKVDLHLPGTDLILFGDRPRLCQIWLNLIENAIKYSRDGSIPRIEVGMRQTGGETAFYVKDNGIGINPQYHSRIFGLFDKLDPKSHGAGLGLSMVQRIVEKCGGRIWVESEGDDKGSCFVFTLPNAVLQD